MLLLLAALLAGAPRPVAAQGVDLVELGAARTEEGVLLDFSVRLTVPRTVDDALQRGVPIYFQAEAALYRQRWYWRNERVARVRKSWRLSYQPLTSIWRVSQGGLHQTYPTQAEALASISRAGHWKLADPERIDPDERYYVDFSYRLDTDQLPRPMQIGIGGQADWAMGIERSFKLEMSVAR